jgi:hypothetical protein
MILPEYRSAVRLLRDTVVNTVVRAIRRVMLANDVKGVTMGRS